MWKPSARSWGTVAVVSALVACAGVPASAAAGTPGAAQTGTAQTGSAQAGTAQAVQAAVAIAPRVDYPSWDEVNAAKQNEQATAAEVTKITSLLDELSSVSAQRANEALQAGQEYLQAKAAAEAASAYAATLQTQADDATAKADTATAQVGALAAQLYRSGGDTTMNLVLNQNDSDSLLYQLGTMTKLTERTGQIRDAAEAAKNTAQALEKQAQTAKNERDTLQTAADERLQAAQDAQAAADAQLAEEQDRSDFLVTQLASLKNVTADVESRYRAGEEAKRQEEERQRQALADQEAPGSAWVPGEVAPASVAQAYAQSILGNYGWGGDQFGCLVQLWIGESGWRANAYNPSSGAYGIPQSLPASKMASVGTDYVTNHETQIIWGMNYISDRYGTPCGALSAWNARNPHWY
ncbi:coiled-coil domain-containing protein [Herbiconiux flava]|uniref:Lytic transglycosylase domain-containing protein n=1 Tax=Herbiconiux flava TaxID=881268 RepID=A0A852SQZ0_9MICO|nr:hypothetical protein [Herbiconiux flava]NYD71130.1 hypothetical protein [Herbiconiux flava]GLK18908.1 hypothetical protein GCM10017602_33900 [Herbiconiux flava]